jgi:hypothetical protein
VFLMSEVFLYSTFDRTMYLVPRCTFLQQYSILNFRCNSFWPPSGCGPCSTVSKTWRQSTRTLRAEKDLDSLRYGRNVCPPTEAVFELDIRRGHVHSTGVPRSQGNAPS